MQDYNIDRAMKGCVVGALVYTNFNIAAAAKLTGLSRATFYRKMKEYNVTRSKPG